MLASQLEEGKFYDTWNANAKPGSVRELPPYTKPNRQGPSLNIKKKKKEKKTSKKEMNHGETWGMGGRLKREGIYVYI